MPAAEVESIVRYYGWDVKLYKGFAIGMEHLCDNALEVKDLHQAHWEETERTYMGADSDIDYGRACIMETQGKLIMFTVRDADGNLVGNCIYFLSMAMHMKDHVQAIEDTFFLSEKARSGTLAITLLKYAEQCLTELGVSYIFHADKAPSGGKDLGKLFKRQGYSPVAQTYVKRLPETTPADEIVH